MFYRPVFRRLRASSASHRVNSHQHSPINQSNIQLNQLKRVQLSSLVQLHLPRIPVSVRDSPTFSPLSAPGAQDAALSAHGAARFSREERGRKKKKLGKKKTRVSPASPVLLFLLHKMLRESGTDLTRRWVCCVGVKSLR